MYLWSKVYKGVQFHTVIINSRTYNLLTSDFLSLHRIETVVQILSHIDFLTHAQLYHSPSILLKGWSDFKFG